MRQGVSRRPATGHAIADWRLPSANWRLAKEANLKPAFVNRQCIGPPANRLVVLTGFTFFVVPGFAPPEFPAIV